MAFHEHICGFYYTTHRADAAPWENSQRHYLPQVGLKSHTTILSKTSRTLLTQTFTNPDQAKAIRNVRYTFPLYDGVSVVAFTCRVAGRLIKGQVKEKEKARQDFRQAAERGQVAGLLEQLPDAADVFTTTVANIPPAATIVAEITYLGELKHDAEVDGIRFTIPTAIAPRYGQYPGELLANPQAHASSGMEIVIDAVSDDGSPIQQLRSPTHPIAVSLGTTSMAPDAEPTTTKASATLSLGTAELDKDFIIQLVAKDTGNPTAILETHPRIPQQRALMATLVPKFSLPSIRPEIVFICDRSGSMGDGRKIPTAIQALKLFLKSLPVGVKFNICSFGSDYTFLWPKSKSYSQDSLEEAIKHVESFSDDYGGTEIFAPLKATFENRHKDMELEVMLLTDGDVWGHEDIFQYLNQQIHDKNESARVFTLGVGLYASSALVEGIARAGNGFSQAVGENEKMDKKIVRMLKGALSPHITDYSLEVKYADEKHRDTDDGFELVEKVTDSLRIHLDLRDTESPTKPETAQKDPTSLFNPSVDLDAPEPHKTSSDGQHRYAHLPPLDSPAILQAPSRIPALFPFNRSTIYLLLSPNSPGANRTPNSVILRGTSSHGPLELEIPVTVVSENDGKGETVHQLAARKAVSELEEGRGWLSEAVDATGSKLKEKMQGRWDELVEREAVRLGVEFQVGGKWCSFVALEQDHEKQDAELSRDWEYLDVEPNPATSSGIVDYQQSLMMLHPEKVVPPPMHMLATQNRRVALAPKYYSGRGGRGGLGGRGGRGGSALGKRLRCIQQAAPATKQPSAVSTANPAGAQTAGPGSSNSNSGSDLGLSFSPSGDTLQNFDFDTFLQTDARFSLPPPDHASSSSGVPPLTLRAGGPPGGVVASAAFMPDEQLEEQEMVIQHIQHSPSVKKKKKVAVNAALVGEPAPVEFEVVTPDVGEDEDGQLKGAKAHDDASPLECIIALQTFEGSWALDQRLVDAVGGLPGVDGVAGVSRELGCAGVESSVIDKVVATVLAVAFLRLKVAEEEETWELVVEKAEEWLKECEGVDGEKIGAMKEKAEALLMGKQG
ncbi:von willebrand domain containing protein [Diplodia corticola]|uniref:von willebrand domain containing protein n=1 Tax=Diplodia corticola TaxID=236234 RepID=A0A1J9S4J0_9PEZI|nr:von willebrand domain containing protein [Diplodia corticola]OJD34549.1 von willebrand domain containing protein [Diplodia corticola]